jgi:hypothetical protein
MFRKFPASMFALSLHMILSILLSRQNSFRSPVESLGDFRYGEYELI